MRTLELIFDTSSEIRYDSAKIEVSGDTIHLKDLGGGSYSTSNPTAIIPFLLRGTSMSDLVFTVSTPPIKVTFLVNSILFYYDGFHFVESDGTYSKSNFLNEIPVDFSELFDGEMVNIGLMIFFPSTGTEKPTLDAISVNYISAETVPTVHRTHVIGKVLMNSGDPSEITEVRIQLSRPLGLYGSTIEVTNEVIRAPIVDGSIDVYLIDTENMLTGTYYKFTIGEYTAFKKVPNVAEIQFNALPAGV